MSALRKFSWSDSRLIQTASFTVWIALLGFLAWSEVMFASRWQHAPRFGAVVAGVIIGAIVIIGWFATTAVALRARKRAFTNRDFIATPEHDSIAPTEMPITIEDATFTEWVDGVNRLLYTSLANTPAGDVPKISLIRIGSEGVELLLVSARTNAPSHFQVLDSGRVWRLNPALSLDDLTALSDPAGKPFLPVLIEVGRDRGATFFIAAERGELIGVGGSNTGDTLNRLIGKLHSAPWSTVSLYRLGDTRFAGSDDVATLTLEELQELDRSRFAVELDTDPSNIPVVVTDDRGLAQLIRGQLHHAVVLGPAVTADQLLYRDDEAITIEPVGLTVRILSTEVSLPESDSQDEGVSDEAASPGPGERLPVQGAVEVRILREHPDLVGDLKAAPNAVAVQFVAYLALHGGKVSTARLRDALGTYRRDASKANKTVWSAAGAARQVLGVERVPNATGNQQYELSSEVTSDWARFAEGFQRARSANAVRDNARAVSLLSGALELCDGLPSSEERRFDWLLTEGILHEVQRVVEEAAHLLATIACESESPALARWAIERGRLVTPISELLDQDEIALDEFAQIQTGDG